MRALEFITGHVIFKLRSDQIYQMKTTLDAITAALKKCLQLMMTC